MKSHEQLKYICDKIWYDWWAINYIEQNNFWKWEWILLDVREIIFTPEFMYKYFDKLNEWQVFQYDVNSVKLELFKNLDNPVEYLYKLIK